MNRRAPRVLLLLTLCCCMGDGADGGPGISTSTTVLDPSTTLLSSELVLTSSSATTEISAAEPVVDAGRIIVDLASIESPAGQGIVLNVEIETSDGRRIPVGRVIPFPLERPGSYDLPLSPRAVEELEHGQTTIVVELMPADEQAILDPGVRIMGDLSIAG